MGPGDIAYQVGFFPGEIFVWFIFLCVAGLVAIILGAVWMYRDAQSRRMDATLWVVLLIVATVFANLIGFIIVLIIYLVVRDNHPVGGAIPYGYGYPPPAVPPAGEGAPSAPATCPVCGNPMTWYPQYARWYCPNCAQYR